MTVGGVGRGGPAMRGSQKKIGALPMRESYQNAIRVATTQQEMV